MSAETSHYLNGILSFTPGRGVCENFGKQITTDIIPLMLTATLCYFPKVPGDDVSLKSKFLIIHLISCRDEVQHPTTGLMLWRLEVETIDNSRIDHHLFQGDEMLLSS